MASNQSCEFKRILRQYRIDIITDKECDASRIVKWIGDIWKKTALQQDMLHTMNCNFTIDKNPDNWVFYTDYLGGSIYWNSKYQKELRYMINDFGNTTQDMYENRLYAALMVFIESQPESVNKDLLMDIFGYSEHLFITGIPLTAFNIKF